MASIVHFSSAEQREIKGIGGNKIPLLFAMVQSVANKLIEAGKDRKSFGVQEIISFMKSEGVVVVPATAEAVLVQLAGYSLIAPAGHGLLDLRSIGSQKLVTTSGFQSRIREQSTSTSSTGQFLAQPASRPTRPSGLRPIVPVHTPVVTTTGAPAVPVAS